MTYEAAVARWAVLERSLVKVVDEIDQNPSDALRRERDAIISEINDLRPIMDPSFGARS